MRHKQYRLFKVAPDLQQPILHGQTRLRVKRAKRLVKQQYIPVVQKRAQQRGALTHTAGQFAWMMAVKSLESVFFYQRHGLGHRLCARYTAYLHTEDDVV